MRCFKAINICRRASAMYLEAVIFAICISFYYTRYNAPVTYDRNKIALMHYWKKMIIGMRLGHQLILWHFPPVIYINPITSVLSLFAYWSFFSTLPPALGRREQVFKPVAPQRPGEALSPQPREHSSRGRASPNARRRTSGREHRHQGQAQRRRREEGGVGASLQRSGQVLTRRRVRGWHARWGNPRTGAGNGSHVGTEREERRRKARGERDGCRYLRKKSKKKKKTSLNTKGKQRGTTLFDGRGRSILARRQLGHMIIWPAVHARECHACTWTAFKLYHLTKSATRNVILKNKR